MTLRFADELRAPEAVGLSSSRKKGKAKSPAKTKKPDAVTLRRFERAIGAHVAKKLGPSVLEDETAEKLLALVERKRKSGKDTVEVPEAARDQEQGAEIIDLMEVLKRSLSGDTAQRPRRRKKTQGAAACTRGRGELRPYAWAKRGRRGCGSTAPRERGSRRESIR